MKMIACASLNHSIKPERCAFTQDTLGQSFWHAVRCAPKRQKGIVAMRNKYTVTYLTQIRMQLGAIKSMHMISTYHWSCYTIVN